MQNEINIVLFLFRQDRCGPVSMTYLDFNLQSIIVIPGIISNNVYIDRVPSFYY